MAGKGTYHIYLCFIIGLCCFSCDGFFDTVSDVDIAAHEPRIVLTGYLDEDKETQVVEVSLSAGYLEGEPIRVNDASLKLYKNGAEIEGAFESSFLKIVS